MNNNAEKPYGILAEFVNPSLLLNAAEKVRSAGYKKFDCHSPFPVHGMDKAMGLKRSPLGFIIAIISFFVMLGGLALQWYTNAVDYPFIISGKPFFSYQAYAPVGFGITIAVAGVLTFIIMLILNGLPKPFHPLFHSENFKKVTDNGFFISIEAADSMYEKEKTLSFINSLQPVNVEIINNDE